MIQPAFGCAPPAHKMAVLKRAVTIVAGNNAVYVRLPSEKLEQSIHAFWEDAVAEDWLASTHKKALSAYREGREIEYEGFSDNIERESRS